MTAPFATLPGLFLHAERTYRNPTAFACKQNDVWKNISSSEFADTTRKIGEGLLELGLQCGDRVGIVADPSPFWMMMDFAVLGMGGITVPLFSNIAPDNLRYEIQDSGMRFLFTGSQEQYHTMSPFFASIERIISLEKIPEVEDCVSWDDLRAMGEWRLKSGDGEWDRLAASVDEKDTATLIYTSGSTGTPKGVELTHKNLISQILTAPVPFPFDDRQSKVLSCLPLAHVFERMVTYYYVSTGVSLYFSADVKKVGADLREIHPIAITMVPRLFEKTFARMQMNVESATGWKGRLGKAAFKRAVQKVYDAPTTLKDKVFDALFDKLVYRKMRNALGGKLRYVISGGAPLNPALYSFFLNIGIPVYEGYGLTESSPVIAVNTPSHRKVGTVGPIFPRVEVRINDDGEILARGPNIMKGYFGKPEETSIVIDSEGWLHTGDLGNIDNEGYLKITGRKKELFKTANGKYVAPVPIEQSLSANKLADMTLLIAEGRTFVTALLFPDMENLHVLKLELNCDSMDDVSFLRSSQARSYLQHAIDEINEGLNHWEKVHKFHLADHILTVDAGEITPTLKIRRHVVEAKFHREIEEFYT